MPRNVTGNKCCIQSYSIIPDEVEQIRDGYIKHSDARHIVCVLDSLEGISRLFQR